MRGGLRLATVALSVNLIGSALLAGDRPERIVTIGGSITEIVHALGEQDRLVARDSTSNFPPEVLDLPDIGYARALSPEGVLSVSPDVVIASEGAGPPETIQVLEAAGVKMVMVPEKFTVDGVLEKIDQVAQVLGAERAAAPLKDAVRQDLEISIEQASSISGGASPKVLFIISAAHGQLIAAGEDSAAAGILALVGAQNALSGFKGYKPVTSEAVSTAAPEAVLMMDRSGPHSISDDDLLALPALAATPAAQSRLVIRMDGAHLLGFGPRTGDAVRELARALYGDRES